MDVGNYVISPQMVTFPNNDVSQHTRDVPESSDRLADFVFTQTPSCGASTSSGNTSRTPATSRPCSNDVADVSYLDLGDCDRQCQHCVVRKSVEKVLKFI